MTSLGRRSSQAPASAQRRDIQGLRAVAVLAVVLDHLVAWPGGGFVGVDVFFVISGFLITGLLLREVQRTRRISFVEFYRRRVRRLMPVAVLVIVATLIASYFLTSTARFDSIGIDAIAAFLFVANWRFAVTGTDYFTESSPVSPLQHYWSLAVEEQFYVVWPLLMVLIVVVYYAFRRGKEGRGPTATLVVAIGVLCLASFGWSLYETANAPTFAYFSTLSRAWELGLGALLALSTPLVARIPARIRTALGWVGLAGIVASIALTTAGAGFPAPWAAAAVLSTVLVLAGGVGEGVRGPAPLTNPVARYLGDISYSLYLWHFPVIVLLGAYLEYSLDGDLVVTNAIVVLVIATLSVASYHLVEDPIRKSNWLAGRARSASGERRRRREPNRFALIGLAGVLTLAITAAAFVVDRESRIVTDAGGVETAAPDAQAGETDAGDGSAQSELTAQIDAALSATEWPSDLTPSPETPDDDPAIVGDWPVCGNANWHDAQDCTAGDPASAKTAVLVGDSIAQMYIPALAQILGTGQWHLRIVSMYACPFIDLPVGDQLTRVGLCEQRRAQEVQEVADLQPDLVIVSNTIFRTTNQDTGVVGTVAEYVAALDAQLGQIAGSAGEIVYLSPPPIGSPLTDCYTPYSVPQDCMATVANSEWIALANGNKAVVERHDGIFIDNRRWFCSEAGQCPVFAGPVLIKKDEAHITSAFAARLAPVIREDLLAAGIDL